MSIHLALQKSLMSAVKFSIKICMLIALSSSAYAVAAPNTSLHQLLQISQDKLNNSQGLSHPTNDASSVNLTRSTWLSGLPSISLSYLGELDNSAIYEQEVSLNLPIKSLSLHRSDARLKQLSESMQGQQVALQRLYLSGLLRQSMWEHRIASVKLQQLIRKAKLLDKLHRQQKQLSKAGELPVVNLLLLERERVDIDLSEMTLKQQQIEAMTLFTSLTGLQEIPEQIDEQSTISEALTTGNKDIGAALMQHPLWQLQSLQQQQQLVIINSLQAGEHNPWTVSLTAKETASEQYSEQYLGLGINIPLGLNSALSQSELSQWQQEQQDLQINRERIYLELTTQTQKLAIEQQNLLQQQQLLARGLSLSRSITEELAVVKDHNQINYEIWLRRYMDALDSESQLVLNKVAVQQLHSQQLQALGISL